MARRQSATVPRDEFNRVSHTADLWQYAYTDLVGGLIEWSETFASSDGWMYTLRLSRSKGGIGGLLVIVRALEGQSPFVSVHHADDVRRGGMNGVSLPADCCGMWARFTSNLYRLQNA